MIEEAVLQRTLQTALRHGGDFAEVFAEDRRTCDGAPRRRQGRGIRVGPRAGRRHPRRARRDHRLRPHRRPQSRPGCATPPTPPRPRRRARRARPASRPSSRRETRPAHEVLLLPETVAKARKVEVLERADDAARSVSDSIRQVSASLRRRPAPDPRRQLRRPARRGRPGPHPLRGQLRRGRRHRHADRHARRPGARSASRSSTRSTRRRSRAPRPNAPSPCCGPGRRRAASCPSCCGAARAACCSTRRAATASRPTSSTRTPRCSAGTWASSSPRRSSRWSTTAPTAREWGTYAIDDEGAPAQRNVLIEDGVLTDYMWDLVRARKHGRASSRQRPARDLPAPADGAHDQHVPARRAPTTPTRSSATPRTASTASRSAAARSTPPPATSCSGSPRRT